MRSSHPRFVFTFFAVLFASIVVHPTAIFRVDRNSTTTSKTRQEDFYKFATAQLQLVPLST